MNLKQGLLASEDIMKTMMFPTLFLTWLVCALVFMDASDAAIQSPAVRDTANKKVRAGTEYYILPAGGSTGAGGGLTLGSNKTDRCPLFVVQDSQEASDGLPLTFSPTNSKKGVIRLSSDVNIKFSVATICVQSTVWKLSNFDEAAQQWFVTGGGVEGNPSRETLDNWFKIDKYDEQYYKLVFCPNVCNYCKVLCRDIGIFQDRDGVLRLALTEQPFKIRFKKM